MAEVVPFQGVRYNSELIPDMTAVVAPPYDVISPREQVQFHERHPNNVIRLILGQARPGDNADDNVYKRAGRYFEQWRHDNILVEEKAPAFYLTAVTFDSGGDTYTRYAVIGRVRLEPFEKGIILPHERTFSKVKSERLMLMKACHANFSPIFGLYPDGETVLERLKEFAELEPPQMNIFDDSGHQHRLWVIFDHELNGYLTSFFESKRIYIADGHHRYETALNYRDWVRDNSSAFNADHPANFVMMSLSSMKDPGMVILPAHRLLKQVTAQAAQAMLDKLHTCFDIIPIPTSQGMDQALSHFKTVLAAHENECAIGLYARERSAFQVMTLKAGVMETMFGDEIEAAVRDLDVTVLTHLVMMELMGFDQARLDDATKIFYRTDAADAVAAVDQGDADLAFVLNATRIEQVQRVAENGLIMPRKSTYFYPKVISGQVFNLLQ